MIQESSKYFDDSKDAIYIHHLATDINYRGVGKEILYKIRELAKKESKTLLRLDNIGSNEKLNQYYEKNGFKKIGVIPKEKYDGKNFGIIRELELDRRKKCI